MPSSVTPDTGEASDRITREDLDSNLRALVGEVEQQALSGARRLRPVLIGAGVLVLVAAYLLGRRVGTTRSTVVEIRRI